LKSAGTQQPPVNDKRKHAEILTDETNSKQEESQNLKGSRSPFFDLSYTWLEQIKKA